YVTSATAAQLQNSSSPFYDDGYKASMVITSSIQSSVNWQWAKVTHKVERVSGNVRCLVTATGLEGDCSTSGVQNGYPVEQITALVNSQGTSKKILVELRPVVTPTQGGPVGLSNVDISGNAMVDSYASGSGVTPPTTKNTDPCNGTSGAVATNGSGNGVMSVQGNAKVCGTATVGVGGTGSSFKIQGSATVVGGTSIATSNVPSTIPTAPASDCTTYDKFSALTPLKDKANYIATPANGFNCFIFTGDVKLSDKTSAYFPAGSTVYFAKELEVEGTATMGSYTGPVGTPTISNLPTDLTFNGTSTAKEVEVESTGTLFANVIAPTASVKVSDNGKAYGGLLGATLKMEGNGHFYYDTNLSGAGSVARYVNYSWNQLE
ncbi:MAG: hypothetical protein HYR81_00835, partial [Nitrospirae bacterium]|nr:hypothetical protein [Nitrospirota bacterium]